MDPKRQEFLDTLKPYCPNIKEIWHPLDIEYFKEYPAPVMENAQRLHYTNLNSTITFFGPMLYYFARAIGAEHILEIGMAEGYTSFYLANAAKDNGTRYVMKGNMYYGVEILGKALNIKEQMDKLELPNDIRVMSSADITPETFKDVTFDIIFQDGNHETEYVVKEFETLWSQLKKNGKGYFIMHDPMGPAEEGWRAIKEKIDNKEYDASYVVIDAIYGLALIRNMEGFDYDKRHWTN